MYVTQCDVALCFTCAGRYCMSVMDLLSAWGVPLPFNQCSVFLSRLEKTQDQTALKLKAMVCDSDL